LILHFKKILKIEKHFCTIFLGGIKGPKNFWGKNTCGNIREEDGWPK
jgi:hypothetical protein